MADLSGLQRTMNNQSHFAERRRSPRFPVSLPIEYWKMNQSGCMGGLAGNISETGLLIFATQEIDVGTKLIITVLFPDGYGLDKFEVLASVVWQSRSDEMESNGYKYGVQFIHISEKDRMKLDHFICAQLSAHLSMNEPFQGSSSTVPS